jgi:hypothetical protein
MPHNSASSLWWSPVCWCWGIYTGGSRSCPVLTAAMSPMLEPQLRVTGKSQERTPAESQLPSIGSKPRRPMKKSMTLKAESPDAASKTTNRLSQRDASPVRHPDSSQHLALQISICCRRLRLRLLSSGRQLRLQWSPLHRHSGPRLSCLPDLILRFYSQTILVLMQQ